jgi:hypothetical protein
VTERHPSARLGSSAAEARGRGVGLGPLRGRLCDNPDLGSNDIHSSSRWFDSFGEALEAALPGETVRFPSGFLTLGTSTVNWPRKAES